MAVLGSIVQPPMLSVLDTRHDLSLGRTVAGQLSVIITRGAMSCFLSSFRRGRLAALALRRL
jgi:hypothetical protein